MAKRPRPVDSFLDAAREVNGWLGLLGSNCCAGRSYRRIDVARERSGSGAGSDAPMTDGAQEPADEPDPARS